MLRKFSFALFVFCPTFFGASVYLLFRSTGLLVFRWLDVAGLFGPTIAIRGYLGEVKLPDWFLYSGPDGLWVFAVTSWMVQIWEGRPPLIWLLSGVVLAVGGELGQLASVVPGTYEHLDMCAYAVAFALASLQLRKSCEEAPRV